jgi:hypothetical protein
MFQKVMSCSLVIVSATLMSFIFYSPARAGNCGGSTPCACGDTLTLSRTLTGADSVTSSKCPADGLIIGQSGITLSLNGRTINGSSDSVGVLISAGIDGVTIRGGRIQDFGRGISTSDLSTTNGSTIAGISAYSNGEYGIYLEGNQNQVNASPARHNGVYGTVVIGDYNTLSGSNNEYNGFDGYNVQGDFNELIGNSASENAKLGAGNGITVIGDDNTLRLNRMTKLNTHGIVIQGNRNVLINNAATKQKGDGIRVDGDDAVLTNNKVTESRGILVEGNGDPKASSGNVSNRGVCIIYGVTGQGICDKK